MATIHQMHSQIEIYEAMIQLSSRMVDAARANEWDQLADLEHGVATLRETLMSVAPEDSLPADVVVRKRSLIQQILENDAEVRRHTEPWMEQVRQFLGEGTRRRDVVKAYAAGAGESSVGSFSI